MCAWGGRQAYSSRGRREAKQLRGWRDGREKRGRQGGAEQGDGAQALWGKEGRQTWQEFSVGRARAHTHSEERAREQRGKKRAAARLVFCTEEGAAAAQQAQCGLPSTAAARPAAPPRPCQPSPPPPPAAAQRLWRPQSSCGRCRHHHGEVGDGRKGGQLELGGTLGLPGSRQQPASRQCSPVQQAAAQRGRAHVTGTPPSSSASPGGCRLVSTTRSQMRPGGGGGSEASTARGYGLMPMYTACPPEMCTEWEAKEGRGGRQGEMHAEWVGGQPAVPCPAPRCFAALAPPNGRPPLDASLQPPRSLT